MRLLSLLAWVALAAVALVLLLRRAGPGSRLPSLPRGDELVKDPVCQTYVVRSRAVCRAEGGEPRYFCSDACARRWAASAGD